MPEKIFKKNNLKFPDWWTNTSTYGATYAVNRYIIILLLTLLIKLKCIFDIFFNNVFYNSRLETKSSFNKNYLNLYLLKNMIALYLKIILIK